MVQIKTNLFSMYTKIGNDIMQISQILQIGWQIAFLETL